MLLSNIASWKEKPSLIIYVSIKISIIMDYKEKAQELSPLNPFVKRSSFWLK